MYDSNYKKINYQLIATFLLSIVAVTILTQFLESHKLDDEPIKVFQFTSSYSSSAVINSRTTITTTTTL